MPKHLIITFLFLLLVFSSACSRTGGKYLPVRNGLPRLSSLGFSITPPPGKDWYEKHQADSLYYFKRTRGNDYAITTQATELNIAAAEQNNRLALLEYVQSSNRDLIAGERYRNVIFDYSFEKIASGQCVRYRQKYDDHGSEKKGHHPYVKVFSKGLVCSHPLSPRNGIALTYMEQSFPEREVQSFRDEGEKFISSLSFYSTVN